ncbi:hypothetical protein PGIGA_G00254090 [Pangasianodon gigas]|uniref:Uncharacterized protein n=1 Tax=Pangasianodon gigas TaxID=30993 RepID=A0ACC5WRX4_PANGG|nr:hypothetical protein [Pangasianodon gigas]
MSIVQNILLWLNLHYVNTSPADQYNCGASLYLSAISISQCQWYLRKKSMEKAIEFKDVPVWNSTPECTNKDIC